MTHFFSQKVYAVFKSGNPPELVGIFIEEESFKTYMKSLPEGEF